MYSGKKTIALSIILAAAQTLAMSAAPAAAATKKTAPAPAAAPAPSGPTRIQQFNAWGAYSYNTGNSKVCYVLSVPAEKSPANIDHGDNFFLVTQRPGQNISYEPQVMAGYVLKAGSKVTVNIDGKVFSMFVKDRSAWLENAAEEPSLVAAMKGGHAMKVEATSQRGTKTAYSYSLSGISASLKQIETCN
jgi:hypothetical protein